VELSVELSGEWRAVQADDEFRRSAVGLEFDDSSWPTTTVPGHWRNDPSFAASDGPLLYRHRFHLDTPTVGERQFVTFDGIFYQADVWLDGAYLGDPEGYFFPHSFEITGLARLATDHLLAVEVACAPQTRRTAKRNITGIFQHWDCADTAWNPGGLWRPVRIETTGPVRIDRLRVLCRDVNDSSAHLRVHARLDCDQPRTATVRTLVDGVLLAANEQSLARGLNEVDWNFDIDEPPLWWPWTMGEQRLTTVTVEVEVDGAPSDQRDVRTGLREVALQDWTFSVNGERLFVKGANLAPTQQALGDASSASIRRDVELARETGLDLVRVVGHIARQELYDAADELGMLVWQDFPLQWNYARSIRKEAVRQAREAVDLLGHHPSIVAWCAHNEPLPVDGDRAAEIGDSAAKHVLNQQLPTWNKSVLDRWVKRAFETNDETRPAIAHSGIAPHLPQLDGTASHLHFGWYYGDEADLNGFAATVPRMVRFVSEFGTRSIPANAEFMHPERWPQLDWAELAERFGFEPAPFEAHVPPSPHATFDAWRTATQRYQATVLRHQIETLRRLKYAPTGGFALMMLNDAGPAVSWSLLDQERQPKLAHQAVIDACRPVIVIADQLPAFVHPGDSFGLDVHVVSDVRRPLEQADCTATLRWPGGNHVWKWQGDVPPDSCVRIGIVRFVVPDAPGELWLDLTIEHGDEVATNRYTVTIAPKV
jgi:beta-mannosidase